MMCVCVYTCKHVFELRIQFGATGRLVTFRVTESAVNILRLMGVKFPLLRKEV